MAEHEWTASDDVQAYAEFVADKVRWERGYVLHVVIPEFAETVGRLTAGLNDFTAAFRKSEIREVAEHPDLAELDVQMKGYYGDAGT